MARFDDNNVPAAIQPYLEPGEQLYHWAYGVKQPSILLMIPLFALAILPGAIATAMLTKNYIIGLTDRRLIVLRFGGKLQVKEVSEYRLHQMPPVEASTGPIFTHIKIKDPQRPFVAKFHRMGMPNNRMHSQAIENALMSRQGGPR